MTIVKSDPGTAKQLQKGRKDDNKVYVIQIDLKNRSIIFLGVLTS